LCGVYRAVEVTEEEHRRVGDLADAMIRFKRLIAGNDR
jgi:hypothetical protein